MSNNKPVRVFSMFTGIGGFEVGLSRSNIEYEMVGFSEIDTYAIKVFEKQTSPVFLFQINEIQGQTKLYITGIRKMK